LRGRRGDTAGHPAAADDPALADRTWALQTEAPGFEVANVRAYRVEGNELRDLQKGLASGAFVCRRWRAGEGDHVA
jgi:hypothetical protein